MASSPTNDIQYDSEINHPFFGVPLVINNSISIIFRLSRPRTWVFPTISLIIGYVSAGGGPLNRLLIGIATACLLTAATNLVNAYADRREDLLNLPPRTLWLDKVGPTQALVVAAVLYVLAGVLGLALGQLFILIIGVGTIDSLCYSLPPFRFKANPVRSLIAFSGAVGLAFLAGMSINGTIDLLNPFFLLCTFFMLTYGSVKNLPDYHGDKRAKIKTSATVFPSIQKAILVASLLLTTPYFLLAGLVLNGTIGTVYLFDLGFTIILALIIRQMWQTKTPEGLEKAHTIGFFYAISFLMFTLILMSPTLLSLILIVSAYAWTLLVSKVNVDSRTERQDWENTIST